MVDHRVILVTAGSAGLGAAVARLFAKQGFRVVVNYSSNIARANDLVAELNGLEASSDLVGGTTRHIAIQADLSSRPDVERLVSQTYEDMKRIDVIFSNGGWTQFRDTTRLDDNVFDEDWDMAYTMNVRSHLWLLNAAEQYLAATEGCFITTASLAGISGMGSSLAYSVTKAAQIHMVKGLASMVGPKIRVNTVSPGLLETDWSQRFTQEQKEQHRSKTKLKRFAKVEDVAQQVLGFAECKSMTGVNIVIDAGFLL
ncbi:hypothetical protein NM208_g3733 [Fusarium decemcellulare]|uniref:Uncharacterized protein n=2 Tax=Fusarium decemcellulare TaxID=57161 RepID=A0ACC1SN00_9HYPO|nr:hypothetical protein NM208_g4850 [Fusarium decemcellulare]KAJ3543136.1 hypothetical protein NM208_g3733 [Fusarium decemcellulare]